MADYDIDIYGGKITVTADTTPAGHNITTKSIPGWCCGATDGSAWTCEVLPNTRADNRTGEITVQITTDESGDYDPTSISEDRTFSFIQAGTGSTPVTTYSIGYVFGAAQDYGTFALVVVPVTGQGERGTASVDGISETGSIGSNYSDGDSVQLVVVNNTTTTRNIGIAYTSNSTPTYNWFYDVAPNDSKYIGVTTDENNKFYVDVN